MITIANEYPTFSRKSCYLFLGVYPTCLFPVLILGGLFSGAHLIVLLGEGGADFWLEFRERSAALDHFAWVTDRFNELPF